MPLFAIIATDAPNSLEARLAARPAHLARVEQQQQRLVLAGPHPNPDAEGFTGSLVVAEFESLTAAKAWAAADPYCAAQVYQQVIVKPFKQVLPVVE